MKTESSKYEEEVNTQDFYSLKWYIECQKETIQFLLVAECAA